MTPVDLTVPPSTAFADLERAADEAAHEAAGILQAGAVDALARYGLEDSALAASIDVEVGETGALVTANAEYARFVEFGTRAKPARPFLGPALEGLRASLTTQIAGRIAEVLATFGRKA